MSRFRLRRGLAAIGLLVAAGTMAVLPVSLASASATAVGVHASAGSSGGYATPDCVVCSGGF
jgi:hypothetical protein